MDPQEAEKAGMLQRVEAGQASLQGAPALSGSAPGNAVSTTALLAASSAAGFMARVCRSARRFPALKSRFLVMPLLSSQLSCFLCWLKRPRPPQSTQRSHHPPEYSLCRPLLVCRSVGGLLVCCHHPARLQFSWHP